MNKLQTLTALLATSAAALSACGQDTESDGEAAPGLDPIDGCSLALEAAVAELDVDPDTAYATFIGENWEFDGCILEADEWRVSFGIRIQDSDHALRDAVQMWVPDDAEAIDDLGDEAYRASYSEDTGPYTTVSVGARLDEHEVLTVHNAWAGASAEDRLPTERLIAFIEAYAATIPEDFVERARATPADPECLTPDSPAITSIIGPVELSRGGEAEGERMLCRYVGSPPASVLIHRYPVADEPDDLQGFQGEEAVDVDGADRARIYSDDYVTFITADLASTRIRISVFPEDGGTVDADAVVDSAEAYFATLG